MRGYQLVYLYFYDPLNHSLDMQVSTLASNQIMACQHPSNNICHTILHNNKFL
jgi:hypothetical protein